MNELLEYLFTSRGIVTDEDKKKILQPDFTLHTHDPFLLLNMRKVVERIYKAKETGEIVGIYTDYDCDGIPGAVAFSDFLEKIGVEHVVYIPDRQLDGYGLSIKGIDYLLEKNATCIITIDLGVTGFEGAVYLKEKNIDLIITDHHLPHDEIPDAFALVNPKQIGDMYPFKELCGTGVIFKIIQGYLRQYENEHGITAGFEKWLLDMVGLATLSDMVPLVDENRIFAHYGLIVMKKTKRPGLLALYGVAGLRALHLAEEDVTHGVTPRLNAASRMGNAYLAYEVLKVTDIIEGSRLAKELESLNKKRKAHVASIMKEVYKLNNTVFESPVIVVGDPSWRPGVLGLVAGKLLDLYKKPVFVWGGSDEENVDILKGSCRGPEGSRMVELMTNVKELFVHFGGHDQAGGFAVTKHNIHDLKQSLTVVYEKLMLQSNPREEIPTNKNSFCIQEIPQQNMHLQIKQFAPFGVGNPKLIIQIQNATILSFKQFGKASEHFEICISINNRQIKGIAFFKHDTDFSVRFKVGQCVTVFCTLEMSYFLRPELRLAVIDIV
jgi:single-stranded-DNA-specific exonuclease